MVDFSRLQAMWLQRLCPLDALRRGLRNVAPIVRINVARVGEAASPALRRLDSEIALHLNYLDSALNGRPYILGPELSAADIQLSFIGELAAARFGIASYPNLEAWIKRFQARPAYKAALARGRAYSFAA
jgi:glutathione S-transferase